MAANGYIWFWMSDDGWKLYPEEHQEIIERARVQGDTHAVIHINSHPYMIDLNDNVQENMQNGNRRVISRASENTVWFWRGDDGRSWHLYGREEAERLTRAESERLNEVYMQVGQTLYQIDLARREQINFETRQSREICQGRPPTQQQRQQQQQAPGTPGGEGEEQEEAENDAEDEEMGKAAPHSFLCPISFRIMRDPVTTSAGSTYERKSIEWWLRDHDTDPLTKRTTTDKFLIPNKAMQETIQDWMREFLNRRGSSLHAVASGASAASESESMYDSISDDYGQPNSNSFSDRSYGGLRDILKIIFLGRNKMGTSTIVQKLVYGRTGRVDNTSNTSDNNERINPPTIKIHEWYPPAYVARGERNFPVKFNVWDFTGRDSFYLFRSIFFSPETLYVIVWDMGVSNPKTRRTKKEHQDADEALKADIFDKVQFWVDIVQEKVPGAVILPVASFCDTFNNGQKLPSGVDIGEDEAKRRCKILKQQLSPGSSTILFGSDDDPVIRVCGPSSIGLAELQERLIQIGTDNGLFGHLGFAIPKRHFKAREEVCLLKESGCSITDVNSFCSRVGDLSQTRTLEALSWLSNVGEALYFPCGPSLPPLLSKYIILDFEWFAGLCGYILRHNLEFLIKEGRRRLGKDEIGSFCGALNTFRTLISKDDASMLWQEHIDNNKEGTAIRELDSADTLDFLQVLLVHFGVLTPVDNDVGPFSINNVCSIATIEASRFMTLDAIATSTVHESLLDATSLFFVPSLLETGDHGDALKVARRVSGSTRVLAQVSQLFGNLVPHEFIGRIMAVLLRNIYTFYKSCINDGHGISIKSVHCWRTVFIIKFSATEKGENGVLKETVAEVCSQLVDSAAAHKYAGIPDSTDHQGSVTWCLFTHVNELRSDGPCIWDAGYGLVLDTIRSVVGGYQNLGIATRVFCPECLTNGAIYGAHSWSLDEVKGATVNKQQKRIRCQRGHDAIISILTGIGVTEDNISDPQALSYRRAVVLVGLYDDKRRAEKIQRLGSGFIVDSARGLIVTAARNVMQIAGRERFGLNYDGIVGAKIVIGVIPADQQAVSESRAIFRYYAKVYAKDPSMDNLALRVCHVDACLLKITSRFENDVGGNGDGCSDEIETLLRDNEDRIRAQALVRLPVAIKSKLQDRVRILGYEQQSAQSESESGPHRSVVVNYQLNEAEGYICQKKLETDPGFLQYQYQPLKTIVVMSRARPGHAGGPCINQEGEVVGILSCADPGEDLRSFIVPVSEWQGLFDSPLIAPA